MAFKISDLKEHNSELLKLLTSSSPDMLWVKDINGIYLYANQAICDGLLMAKDTKEPIGKDDVFFALREREKYKDRPYWHTFGELCFDSDKTVIDNNKAMKFEEYGNVKGEMLYLEVSKAPFYDKEGNIIGTVGSGRDITQLKMIQLDLEEKNKILAQQQEQIESFNAELEKRVQDEINKRQEEERMLIHQSRQAGMGELLESIAHQWRQPLNIIGIASANLVTLHDLDALVAKDFEEKMEIISSNINYMSDTIDDFRNYLSPNRSNTNFVIESCIEQTISVFYTQENMKRITQRIYTDSNLVASGVENEFKQVILILLSNAIDSIKLRFKNNANKDGKILIELSKQGDYAHLNISDNGTGINADIFDSIFDAYSSTKSNSMGTGIGLYIARKIIQDRMQGSIKAQNISEGSMFTITIPLANTQTNQEITNDSI